MDTVIHLIESFQELSELQGEWNELLQRSTNNNIFLTWEWISCWCDHLREDRIPWLWAVRQKESGKLIGLLPLTQRQYSTQKGLRYLEIELIGSYKAAPDHLDWIIDAEFSDIVEPILIKELFSFRKSYKLNLKGIRENSTLAHYLSTRPGYSLAFEEVCPYTELPSDWETYRSSLSRNMRRRIGKNSRRLERQFPQDVSYENVNDKKELEQLLHKLFMLNSEVRIAHGDLSDFEDDRMRNFHICVASKFLENGWLRFNRLKVEGEDIALDYNFLYNNVLSSYQGGYSLDWGRHSPGILLLAYTVQEAIKEGATELDLLRGAEPYKLKWAAKVRHILDIEYSQGLVRKFHEIYLGVDNRIRYIRNKTKKKLTSQSQDDTKA